MAKKEKSQPGNGQAQASQDQSQQNQTQPEFIIQRIYIKDISYEAPSTPQIFRQEWQPTINLDINTKSTPLEQTIHEVVLTVTATAKLGEATAFLAEVKQAGIFTIQRFPEDQMKQLLGSYCPGILFPYAREVITDLVMRGGFPPLYLAPINFDILYQQHLQTQTNKDNAGTGTSQQ